MTTPIVLAFDDTAAADVMTPCTWSLVQIFMEHAMATASLPDFRGGCAADKQPEPAEQADTDHVEQSKHHSR